MTSTPPNYVYLPDNCGNGGTIGIRFYSGGPNPMTTWTNQATPYAGYTGSK